MDNRDVLKNLLVDVFLLEPEEFRFDMTQEDIETWDSLGVVSMAVGVHESFGYHFTPEEAMGIKGVQDIVDLLEKKGVPFA